jgi:4-hydroxy-tetrahydrodipicolinate synthase
MEEGLRFEGVFPILPTPFEEDERLDLESLDRMVRFMADLGVDGVVVLGVLGEAGRMTDAEREQVIRTAVAAASGRIPVVVGTSHRGTRATLELSLIAESLGAEAVMIAPPREPVPSDERIVDFYRGATRGLSVPAVIQDHPASTEVHLPVPLLVRLVAEVPAAGCIKEEAVPTPPKVAALANGMKARKVPVLTGLGGLYALFDLEGGCDGFMTGFAFPEALIAMFRAARGGRWDTAYEVYRRFLPLIVFEQQPGVAVRKEIFRMRGLIGGSRVRHPGPRIGRGTVMQLRQLLARCLPETDLTKPLSL